MSESVVLVSPADHQHFQLDENIFRFRDAFARMGSLAALDIDFKFSSLSREFTEIFGYKTNDLHGLGLHNLDYAGLDSPLLEEIRTRLLSCKTWNGDMIARRKDDSSINVHVTIAPSFRDGKVIGYLAQYQTVQEGEGSAAYELNDSFFQIRGAINRVAAFAVMDSKGNFLDINEEFLKLYKYDRADLVGKHMSILEYPPQSKYQPRKEIPQAVIDAFFRNETFHAETQHYCKDGSLTNVRVSIVAAPHKQTQRSFLLLHQNISKEVEMREQQREMAVEAARQQMLQGALHNIGNLQAAVNSGVDRSKEGSQRLVAAVQKAQEHYQKLSAEQKDMFFHASTKIMLKNAEAIMQTLTEAGATNEEVNAILRTLKNEQKNIRVSEKENTHVFIQRLMNIFAPRAQKYGIGVYIDSQPDIDVMWPLTQVHQIIFNFLVNAQQAITEQIEKGDLKQHHGKIEFSAVEEPMHIVFSVKDNGGGIKEPEKLFTQYYTTKKSGSGIGLNSSAIMAQAMGGEVKAKNSEIEGRLGAQFTLRLPKIIESKGLDDHE